MAQTTAQRPAPARLPDYTPRRGQRGRDRLRGLFALLCTLVLVVGVPVGLIFGVGLPDSLSLPDRSWITSQLDTTTVLQIFSLVVWVAWAHFVICLISEWRSERRGAPSPSRVLLGGGSQLLARRLVASVLLISGAATLAHQDNGGPAGQPQARAAVAAPALSGAELLAPTGGARTVAPAQHAAPTRHTEHATAVTVPAHVTHAAAGAARKYYEVKAHQGRHYDTLWGIAERYLGDGRRYPEIFALNRDRMQPDGGALTKPDLIRPGWVLRLPKDAEGAGLRVVTPVPVHLPVPVPHHPAAKASPAPVVPADVPVAPVPHTQAKPLFTVHQAAAPASAAAPVADVAAPADHNGGLSQDLLGGSLVAAGLLLGLRRRKGAFGAAGPQEAVAESALRLAADVPTATFLDRATRQLCAELSAAQRSLPEVYAALVDDAGLTVCFHPAEATAPPAPWVAADDLSSWSISAADLVVTPAADEVAAPFPGLAVFGVLDRRRVLLDLEAAPGMVSIGGDGQVARNLAASVAVELATNAWSDDVRVTLVGFGDTLAALAPHRMRHAESLDEALALVETRLSGLASALDAPDAVLRGRRRRESAETWRPEVLVVSAPPTADETQRIAALLGGVRQPVAVIVVGDVPQARWRFVARPDGSLDTGVLGIELEAASLPAEQYRPLMSLFADAAGDVAGPGVVMAVLRRAPHDRTPDGPDGAPAGGIVLPISVELAPEMLRLDRRFPVEVRLLGPISVVGPGVLDPDRADLSTEIVTYVALHPHGVHPNVLQAAIWPRGATPDVVDAAIGHVQSWLGRSQDGRERLALVDGRWVLSADVRVDWPVFRALIRQGAVVLDVEAALVRALSLVTGPFGDRLPAGRYGWLPATGAEQLIRAAVVSAAHEASELALRRGDGTKALAHARTGLLMLATSELLWRDALRAAASSEDPAQLHQIGRELTSALGGNRLREPSAAETDALLGELLPGFGRVAA